MIRILSIKIFKQNVHTNRIYDYSLNLTGLASQHKGFIDSENFWNYNMDNMDDSHLFTLSKWQTLKDWDNWKHSIERKKFHEDCLKDEYIGLFNDQEKCEPGFFLKDGSVKVKGICTNCPEGTYQKNDNSDKTQPYASSCVACVPTSPSAHMSPDQLLWFIRVTWLSEMAKVQ